MAGQRPRAEERDSALRRRRRPTRGVPRRARGGGRHGSGGRTEDAIERVLSKELPLPAARAAIVEEFERRYVGRVLERHGGNVSRAAAASGIALRYFQLLKAKRTK